MMFSPSKTTTSLVEISLGTHKLIYQESSTSKISAWPLKISGSSTAHSEDDLLTVFADSLIETI